MSGYQQRSLFFADPSAMNRELAELLSSLNEPRERRNDAAVASSRDFYSSLPNDLKLSLDSSGPRLEPSGLSSPRSPLSFGQQDRFSVFLRPGNDDRAVSHHLDPDEAQRLEPKWRGTPVMSPRRLETDMCVDPPVVDLSVPHVDVQPATSRKVRRSCSYHDISCAHPLSRETPIAMSF